MSISNDITQSIKEGRLDKFRELVNHPAILINEIFNDGLLHYLLKLPERLNVEWFLVVLDNINLDVNKLDRDGNPPILCIELPKNIDILQLLLKDIRTNIFSELKNGNTVLNEAIQKHPNVLYHIINSSKFNSSLYCDGRKNPLTFAINTNIESLKIMLEKVDIEDCLFNNPLVYAFKKGNVEAFRILMHKGFSINAYVNEDDDTLAEFIILGDNHEFISILIDNLKFVNEKDRLLLFAISTNKIDIVDDLLRIGCSLSEKDFSKLLKNERIMLRIIHTPNIVKPIQAILETNNITLIRAMLNEPSINFKSISWNRTLNNVNINILEEVLKAVLTSKILSIDELNVILISHVEYNFNRLLEFDKFDIIDKILEAYPDLAINPNDFTPITNLIYKKQFNIVLKLVRDFKVIVNSDQMFVLMEYRQRNIIEIILNTYSIEKLTDIYSIYANGENLLILLELFRDDKVLTQKILDIVFVYAKELEYSVISMLVQNPDIFLHILEEFNINLSIFNRNYENVEDLIEYKPLTEMFNTYSSEHCKRLLDIIKQHDEFKNNLVGLAITTESQKLFDLIMMDHILLENPNSINDFSYYITNHTDFTLDNLDNILRLPNISIDIDVIKTAIIIYINENALYRRSRLIDKILAHNSFNPNEFIDFKDNEVTILYYIIDELLKHEPQIQSDDTEEFLRIARLILRNPLTDVNIGHITPASYLASQLEEFITGKDYSRMGSYDARCILLSEILAHRSFDINQDYDIMLIVINGKLIELFTILISNPKLDVNNSCVLHEACLFKSTICIEILLTLGSLDINRIDNDTGYTPLQYCIAAKFTEGALLLVNDPRINLTILDSKGRTYIKLANKAGMSVLADRLAELGQSDLKKERVDREVAEYDARMVLLGRRKEGRIRETLNNFDLILKERETEINPDDEYPLTPYNLSICPFCLTYLEKEQPYECVYLAGHVCPPEIQNEELKRLYFGENWQTTAFEVCCTCGRPCSHHGHYEPLAIGSGQTSTLLPNGALANHWRCDEHNGGGGKLEMVVRLTGILSELKARVDRDEILVYGPELIRELTAIANSSLFDAAIRARAVGILERKKWNSNSKVPKYARFNAPNVNTSTPIVAQEREPISHISNIGREDKLSCMICLDDEVDDVFKPHAGDAGYICGDCLKGQVCASPYASVTCELGCNPKKQIHKEDVNALMGGNFCQ